MIAEKSIVSTLQIISDSWREAQRSHENDEDWIKNREDSLRNASIGGTCLFIAVCIRKFIFKI